MKTLDNKLSFQQYRNITIMCMTLLVTMFPYLGNTFYVQFIEGFGLTDAQFGTLMTMYGLTATPAYLFGGFVADKFNPKKLLILSCWSTAAFGVLLMFVKSFAMIMVIFACFGVTVCLLQWSAFLKMVRSQGTDDQQGRIFGYFEFAGAAVIMIANYIVLAAMGKIIDSIGFKWVLLIYAAIIVAVGLAILFLVDDPKENIASNDFKFSQIGEVVKNPVVWMNAFLVMGMYVGITGVTYMNPWLTNVMGVNATLVVALMIGAKSAFRLFSAPIGGVIIDKTNTPTLIVSVCAAAIIVLIGMTFMPWGAAYATIGVIIAVIYFVLIPVARPGMYTPIPEGGVPMEITGTAMGLVSAVGYSTDIWFYNVCGRWLTEGGDAGFRNIFLLMAAMLGLAIVCALLFAGYKKKHFGSVNALPGKAQTK